MSQIHNDCSMKLDHYQSNILEPTSGGEEFPPEFRKARPVPAPSRWKMVGRIALGITTCGLSEIIRLAYRGIKACCSSSRPASATRPRISIRNGGAIPNALPEVDSFNDTVGLKLLGSQRLPGDLEDAAREALAELRDKFGTDLVPEGQSVKAILGGGAQRLYARIKDLQSAVTPEQIREWVLLEGRKSVIMKMVTDRMKELWPNDAGKMSADLPDRLLMRYPELKTMLENCESTGEMTRLLEEHEDMIQSVILQKRQLEDLRLDARTWFAEALAEGLGSPHISVSDLELGRFNTKTAKIVEDILTGKYEGCGEVGFDPKQALRAFAREQADIRIREYRSIDNMPELSDELKAAFKHLVITKERILPGEFNNYAELGSKVDATALMELLEDPHPDSEALQKELLSLADKLDSAFRTHFGEENWHNMDPDVKEAIQAYASQVMLDKIPGLRKALAEYPGLRGLSDWCMEQMYSEETHPQYGIRLFNIAGIARLLLNSTEEIGIRVKEMSRLNA